MTIFWTLIIISIFLLLFLPLIQKHLGQPRSKIINEEGNTENFGDQESYLSDRINVARIEDLKISDGESDSQSFISKAESKNSPEDIQPLLVKTNQQIVSEQEEPFIDLRNCAKIYDSFLSNFYYHRNGIRIHLKKLEQTSNSWDCELFFEQENTSKKANISSWDKFLFVYIDSFFQDDLLYESYKSRIHSISYDLKIIMEIKSSLVMFKKTSSYRLYSLVDEFNKPPVKEYIMQICDVIFNDESEFFESFDPLVDKIIDSVPPSFWDKIIVYKRFPTFSSSNINSLTYAFVCMFSCGYSNFGKHLSNSCILQSLSRF